LRGIRTRPSVERRLGLNAHLSACRHPSESSAFLRGIHGLGGTPV